VTQIDLTGESVRFEYLAVPKLTKDVYLKCIAKNDSLYTLLEANMLVFMDNFFISKTRLRNTSPGSAMEIYLGTDSSVKLELPKVTPIGSKTNKLFSKKMQNQTCTRVTKITNNKDEEIDITVFDQIPIAADESIKVKILEPPEETVVITPSKLAKFVLKVPAQSTESLNFSYIVGWPEKSEIEYYTQKVKTAH